MNSCCILISFGLFVTGTICTVLWLTQNPSSSSSNNNNNNQMSGIRFRIYNPLSYKTMHDSMISMSRSSGNNNDDDVHYYATHSVWDELLVSSPNNSSNSSSNDHALYQVSDFRNPSGTIPPYWNCLSQDSTLCNSTNDSLDRGHHGVELGPCFAPHQEVDWGTEIQKYYGNPNAYTFYREKLRGPAPQSEDWANYCRPGFIIIGAGKCGTSSLYHYITDHPRVLPAREKQIHYFKYYTDRSLKWYFNHFPTTVSFLASGALMTGEASPGYLPYPDVPFVMRKRLTSSVVQYDSSTTQQRQQQHNTSSLSSREETYIGPKIITIGREPLDRAYSSYKYNYVTPTLERMRRGKFSHIPKDRKNQKPDSFYKPYLFTFEEMLKAELKILRECLSEPNGLAVAGARARWGSKPWMESEFQRRQEQGLPPLVDLDGYCYGDTVSSTIPRRQWIELMEQNPEKVIESRNVHLKQSLIGRGLYVLPLEWWYVIFPKEELYFVCTEELSDQSGAPLNELADFLGLPPDQYNFSESVASGAYNVGGHRGYDKEIPWEEIKKEEAKKKTAEMELSPEFRKELEDFVKPFNERLFELVGRRCNW